MVNIQDLKEILKEEAGNTHTLLKWAWRELSWEAQKQRAAFAGDFQSKVNALSDKEKQFLVDFIEAWWEGGFDFSAKSVIGREFPERKDQLLEIVHIISQDGFVTLNEWGFSLQLDIKALHDNLENELENRAAYHNLSEQKKKDKGENNEEAQNLIKQLHKDGNIEVKENPTITEVVDKLERLLKDEKAYRHTKLIKETIELLNKNQNLNELDEYWHPVLGRIVALSYYPLGEEALKTVLKDKSLDVNAEDYYALSLAVSNLNLKAVKLFLKRGDLYTRGYLGNLDKKWDTLGKLVNRLWDIDYPIGRVGKIKTTIIKKRIVKLIEDHASDTSYE